ncbi:MAG: type II toxin-antitoxin system RelE/ParE family toxin [Candidatus Brocadiales bacterium]
MRKLVWHTSFRRAFKKCTKKKPYLAQRIFDTLQKLASDPFEPSLETHKLKGRLEGLWACKVEYDCRIVFGFENIADETGRIVLIDIGTHEEVY